MLNIFARGFELMEADEHTLKHMEQFPEQYPQSDEERVSAGKDKARISIHSRPRLCFLALLIPTCSFTLRPSLSPTTPHFLWMRDEPWPRQVLAKLMLQVTPQALEGVREQLIASDQLGQGQATAQQVYVSFHRNTTSSWQSPILVTLALLVLRGCSRSRPRPPLSLSFHLSCSCIHSLAPRAPRDCSRQAALSSTGIHLTPHEALTLVRHFGEADPQDFSHAISMELLLKILESGPPPPPQQQQQQQQQDLQGQHQEGRPGAAGAEQARGYRSGLEQPMQVRLPACQSRFKWPGWLANSADPPAGANRQP